MKNIIERGKKSESEKDSKLNSPTLLLSFGRQVLGG